ncbi:MAG: hypothetical protein QG673_797, partial [Pseudomonadota bacterium]|nr:hypothetical protein [Pseudomonadota bacterium]
MKKLILSCICLCCIYGAFADNGILTDQQLTNYINATLIDEFVSSVTTNPAIYRDANGNQLYTAANPISSQSDFTSIDTTYMLTQQKGASQQVESLSISYQSVIWNGISNLTNTSTMMQTLQSQEFNFTRADSVSSTTSLGWKAGLEVSDKFTYDFMASLPAGTVAPEPIPPVALAYQAPASKAPASKAPASKAPASQAPAYNAPASQAPASQVMPLAANNLKAEITVKVYGEINGNKSTTNTCTTTRSYTAKSQNVNVAPGCTAIVNQSLIGIHTEGPYTFTSYIDPKSFTQIATSCCGQSNRTVKTGKASIADIIRYGQVPESAIYIDKAGNVVLVGRGDYKAVAGTQFDVTVSVKPGNDLYGNPCTAELESQTLYTNNNSNG